MLDRLGRLLKHLSGAVAGLSESGVGFLSLQEAIDTTTSGGKPIFHGFSALAVLRRASVRHPDAADSAVRDRAGGRQPGTAVDVVAPHPLADHHPDAVAHPLIDLL